MPNVCNCNHVRGSIVFVASGVNVRTGLLPYHERDKPVGVLVGVSLLGFHAQVHRVPHDIVDVLLHGPIDAQHCQRSNQRQIQGRAHGQLQSIFPIQTARG